LSKISLLSLWNPKVHCRVHKGLQLVHILNEINPDHTHPVS